MYSNILLLFPHNEGISNAAATAPDSKQEKTVQVRIIPHGKGRFEAVNLDDMCIALPGLKDLDEL